MHYRIIILLFLSIVATPLNANMASPILEGTLGGRTFINKSVDVVSENIFIQPDSTFTSALIRVQYKIHADTTGLLIPILFHAEGYAQGIKISFDKQGIDIDNCFAADYNHLAKLGITTDEDILIKWDDNNYLYENIDDLKYFEVDITQGHHTIEISYYADVWTDRSDWVKTKSFRYSLSPIKYWKSVGDISVAVDHSKIAHQNATISTNLGTAFQEEGLVKTWVIKTLDKEYIKIAYLPKVSILSKALMKITPGGIAILAMLIFTILHIKLLKQTRAHLNLVVFAGSLLVPVLSYLVYYYAYELIDLTLQDNASRFHGYTFLNVALLPFVIIIYALIVKSYSKTLRQ